MAFATGLLGTHVGGRTAHPGPLPEVHLLERQAEVTDVGLPGGVDQNVARLDVPVDQSLTVCIMQSLSYRRHQFGGPAEGGAGWLDVGGEVAAVDELRDDVTQAVPCSADIEDRNDVGVVQTGQNAGLGQVRLDVFRPRNPLPVRHLDGDRAMQLVIVGQVDLPEPASAQELLRPVAANLLRQLGCNRIRTAHFRGRRRERTRGNCWLTHGQDTLAGAPLLQRWSVPLLRSRCKGQTDSTAQQAYHYSAGSDDASMPPFLVRACGLLVAALVLAAHFADMTGLGRAATTAEQRGAADVQRPAHLLPGHLGVPLHPRSRSVWIDTKAITINARISCRTRPTYCRPASCINPASCLPRRKLCSTGARQNATASTRCSGGAVALLRKYFTAAVASLIATTSTYSCSAPRTGTRAARHPGAARVRLPTRKRCPR